MGLSGQAQLQASGTLPTLSGAPITDRWAVKVDLDDEATARAMAQGTGGTLVVYTDTGSAFHVISKVAIRLAAWMNYLTSP